MWQDENARAKTAARDIAFLVNSFSFDEKAVAKAMASEHRTLQQTFTRLCIAWLRECADENYRTDDRNDDSKLTAQTIEKALKAQNLTWDDLYLPFI